MSRNSLAGEQAVDQRRSLVGVRVGQELLPLGGGRQQADQVDVGPAEERLVGADLRRDDVEPVELGMDERVDLVERPGCRASGTAVPGRTMIGTPEVNLSNRARMNASPGPLPVASPWSSTADGGVVVAEEDREPGDVAVGPVGVSGPDDQPLGLGRRGEDGPGGKTSIPTGSGDIGRVGRGAGLEPAQDDLVSLAAGLDPLAAGVGDPAGRLVQEQAVLGRRRG